MSEDDDLLAARDRLRAVADGLKHLSQQVSERDRLRALVFLLYRTLSDEPVETLTWLSPDQRQELAGIVAALNPHLARPDEAEFYVCPDHTRTGGHESCCECGGWEPGAEDYGRQCSEQYVTPEELDNPNWYARPGRTR